MTVLIIEDDPLAQGALSRLISSAWKIDNIPLEIVCVDSLARGLAVANAANVTILDLLLKDSDAIATIQAIRSFRPPVIVLTGDGSPEITASCMAHGAAHVFVKGHAIGFIAAIFEALQRDVVQKAQERQNAADDPPQENGS